MSLSATDFKRFDRFTKLNVLWLLGQTFRELKAGNETRAMLYFGTSLLAFKYTKLSLAVQGILTADRQIGRVTGIRPVASTLPERND